MKEKTVKQLRQMARDKSISGYSGKKKSELVEMIKENYLKDEIRAWPDLGLEEIGGGESIGEEEEEEPEGSVPVEEMEVDMIFGVRRDLVYVLTVIGSAVAGIIAVIAFYLHYFA